MPIMPPMKSLSPNIKYMLVLFLQIFFGCQNEPELDGNYYLCKDGYYAELYIKNDSIRMAYFRNGNVLTAWQEVKIKNDTLCFMQFGHLNDSIKGKMRYIEKNTIEFNFIIGSGKHSFEEVNILNRMDNKLNFKSVNEFWAKFKKRQNIADCQIKLEKGQG